MKITPIKGRPMLHWVGKRPIDTVSNYPAQLVDTYNVENPEKERIDATIYFFMETSQ